MDFTQYGPDPAVARAIEQRCRVIRPGPAISGDEISLLAPVALCAELDYPDITRLATLSAIKRRHPQLPILMFTEQHSESLAVWALRSRMWNYFVKPVDAELVVESLDILQSARAESGDREKRPMRVPSVSLPKEIRFRDEGEKRRTALCLAENYINTHLSERFSVEEVATASGVTAVQLTREFKHSLGSTISGYVLKQRIHLACELLRNRSASVNDIGWTVGLRDPSHFTRTFRNHVGVSPSEYRSLWQAQHGTAASRNKVSKSSNEEAKLS